MYGLYKELKAPHVLCHRSGLTKVPDAEWISVDEIAVGFMDGTVSIFKLGQEEPVKTLNCQVVELMNEQALILMK
jgi:hypothetical protein